MISVRIHRDQDDEHGVQAQLMTIPRLGKTISIPYDDGGGTRSESNRDKPLG
jgi:hypothetical protein